MKIIKNIGRRIWRFIKRYKYILSIVFVTTFIWWLLCLPNALFTDPTSTVVLDKEGNLLGATIADDGQWRFPYNDHVPEKFKTAIIQFEDRSFESHWGVSIKGLSRAVWQNLSAGEKVSGGSTITMQLMRMSRKGQSRNIWQKFIEIFWATRAEWRYSKDEILALYASNAPMGGNVVGLDAAAWRYFGRSPDNLTWAETATLAVLPNAPSLMHPGKNREALFNKRNRLLDRLFEIGTFDSTTWILSKMEELPEKPHPIPQISPQLLTRFLNEGKKGQVIHTTIDLNIQERVNKIVSYHHQNLKEDQIYNAAVLVMEVETGNVIAYTGNVPNLDEEYQSAVDVITAPRSTGSILKPFLYAAMLENGEITPEMLINDIPTVMSGYSPKNYNLKYDGMVPASTALSRSLNVPLVRMLTKFGVAKFHFVLNQLQFTTITKSPDHYGLSLILGGAEVTLWDLVSAYGMLARTLNQYPNYDHNLHWKASLIDREMPENYRGPFFNPATIWYTFEAMKEVMRPEDDINWELFSSSQQIAWKTGTSFGFRDAWAVGVTPKYCVGVWVGNADGEGRPGLIGREAAAPILFDVFSSLPQSDWFSKPFDEMLEIEICKHSGYKAGEYCEEKKTSFIPKKANITSICPYHKNIFLDESGVYQVNASCYDMSKAQTKKWFVLPANAEYFYKNHDPNYKTLPPFLPGCATQQQQDEMAIIYPKEESSIYIPRNFYEEKEKIVLEATHILPNMKLFWHLDDIFLGTTERIHEMSVQPPVGEHTLTILDEKGNFRTVKFEIRNK